MKLPASPEANQKQNAVIVVVQPPAAGDPPVDVLHGLTGLLDDAEQRALRSAMFRDLGVKMRQWAEFATCFLLADETAAVDAGELAEQYERLEFTGDQPTSFREGLGLLLEAVWEQNFRRVVFVDAFAPGLPAGLMRDAFEWLWERDVVVGPNVSGGCYLIGLRDLEARVLPEASWHDPLAFVDTVEHTREAGLTLQLVDYWNALATPRDLVLLYAHLAGQAAHGSANAPTFEGGHTFEALQAVAEGDSLLTEERFRGLLAGSQPGFSTISGEIRRVAVNGNAAAGQEPAHEVAPPLRPARRPLPAGGAPAPLPSDIPPRERRGR